jgi:hypothetical protein
MVCYKNMMRFLTIAGLTIALLLAASAPAWAGLDWGADAFSVDLNTVVAAEGAMGTAFESYAIYGKIDHPGILLKEKSVQARHESALIYLNINSRFGISRGGVPACFSDVAAGAYDDLFHAWTDQILSLHYPNMLITFNHEPMLNSPSQPKCSHTRDNSTTYRAAFSHVEKLFKADGVTAPWAYVMTWAATQWSGGLDYRPAPHNFQVIGTDQYFLCNNQVYQPPNAFKSFFKWTALNAPTKPVLVGEIGALTTCPTQSLNWLAAAKTRLLAHNVLAINWNLRTDEDHLFNPLLQPDIKAWWLHWASQETG